MKKLKGAFSYGKISVTLEPNRAISLLKRLICQRILFFYINQGYQSFKDNKKVYYNDVYVIVQIMPLSQQPKNIENYELKEDEVKIVQPRYDPVSGELLGIEYCVALVTVRDDPEEQFFDYSYNKVVLNQLCLDSITCSMRVVLVNKNTQISFFIYLLL